MVTKRKRRKARRNASYTPVRTNRKRRRRKARRNAWYNDTAGHRKAARKGWRGRKTTKAAPAKSRKRKSKRTRKNPVYRVRRRVARRNPVRRRRSSRRRMNPVNRLGLRRAFSRQWLMQSLTIAGGIVSGMLGMPLVYRLVPEGNRTTLRPYLGVVHVLLGSMLFGFMKNKNVKEMGVVIAGTGVYDLLASNIDALGLPPLPVSSSLIDKVLPAPAPVSASYNVMSRPVSRIAASYNVPQPTVGLGSTWEPDEWQTESPYAGVFQ